MLRGWNLSQRDTKSIFEPLRMLIADSSPPLPISYNVLITPPTTPTPICPRQTGPFIKSKTLRIHCYVCGLVKSLSTALHTRSSFCIQLWRYKNAEPDSHRQREVYNSLAVWVLVGTYTYRCVCVCVCFETTTLHLPSLPHSSAGCTLYTPLYKPMIVINWFDVWHKCHAMSPREGGDGRGGGRHYKWATQEGILHTSLQTY